MGSCCWEKKDISFQLFIQDDFFFFLKNWLDFEEAKRWKKTESKPELILFFPLNQLFHPDENKTKGSNPKA